MKNRRNGRIKEWKRNLGDSQARPVFVVVVVVNQFSLTCEYLPDLYKWHHESSPRTIKKKQSVDIFEKK